MSIVPGLALCAALFSASATVLIRQGLRRSDPYAGLWIAVFVSGGAGAVSTRSLLIFALAGLIGTVAAGSSGSSRSKNSVRR